MKLLCRRLVAVAILVASTQAFAKIENFKKVTVSSTSKDGAIMFRAMMSALPYEVMFSPFDRTTRTVSPGVKFSIDKYKAVRDPSTGTALKLKSVEPGYYVMRMLVWQDWWGACLSEQTFGFEVKPGKVTFLGTLDPRPTLETIQIEAHRTGKLTSSGGRLRLFKENMLAPFILPGTEPEGRDLTAIARQHQLTSDAPVFVPQIEPANFVRKDKADLLLYCS